MIEFSCFLIAAFSCTIELFNDNIRRMTKMDWNEFYDETNNSYFNGIVLNDKSYYILDIVSANSKSRFLSYGLEVSSAKILIESSLFYNNSYNDGGCNIHIESNGNIVQKRVCAYKCSASGSGQHCYIRTSFNQEEKNYNIESSYSNLVNSNGDSPIVHSYSKVIVKRVNISYCYTNTVSGFWLADSNFKGNMTYSLFSSNNASHNNCFKLCNSYNFRIINCNIINNNVSDQLILIYGGTFEFIDCSITNNNADNKFWIARSGDYTVISCIYDFEISNEHIAQSAQDLDSYVFEDQLTFYETAECGPISILEDTNTSIVDFIISLINNPTKRVPSLLSK